MNRRKKNIRLLLYLVSLIVVTLIFLVATRERSGVSFDRNRFKLEENTVITTVAMEGSEGHVRLEYNGGRWEVNSKHEVDLGMRDVFFSVLSRVEIRRPAPGWMIDSLIREGDNRGVKVTILNNVDTVLTYLVLGDEKLFTSFFIDVKKKEAFFVHLPGYLSFVAGIYYAGEKDWRNRLIWPIDWTQLRRLSVDFQKSGDPELEFTYTREFITVEGIPQMDTALVVEYLQRLAGLEALAFLDTNQKIDRSSRRAFIEIEEIGTRRSSLQLYEVDTFPDAYIGILNDEDIATFRKEDIDALLRYSKEFASENHP